MRYQPGDIGRLLPVDTIAAACAAQTDRPAVNLHLPLIAITGRDRDRLTDGTHVEQYKDALYVDKDIADRLTGGFRLEHQANGKLIVHLQLRQGLALNDELQQRLRSSLSSASRAGTTPRLAWEQFPFGMTLDYERKFAYFQ